MVCIDQLIAAVPSHPVQDVLVGCFTTCVHARNHGLASTLKPAAHSGFGLSDAGNLTGMDVQKLARMARSTNTLDASVGIAAINSMADLTANITRTGNARELLLEKGAGKTLGMIGHFPFVERVRNRFRATLVFELVPQPGDMEANRIPERLGEADVVALTATSLINHTFSDVMQWIRKDAFVVLLGPSTPLYPRLFDFGIDALCGSVVTDSHRAMEMMQQAAPFRKLEGIEHVMLLKEDAP